MAPFNLKQTIGYLLLMLSFALSSIAQSETLRAVTLEAKPYTYQENDAIKGINADLAREAIRRTGYKLTIDILPWARAVSEAREGNADLLFNAAYTDERANWLHYPSEIMLKEQWVFFTQKNKAYDLGKDYSQVSEFILGTQTGYQYGGEIQRAINEKRFKNIEVATNTAQILLMLQYQRIDLAIVDMYPGLYLIKQLGLANEIEILKSTTNKNYLVISESPTYLAISKKVNRAGLIDKIDSAFISMKKDGTYNKIIKRYL